MLLLILIQFIALKWIYSILLRFAYLFTWSKNVFAQKSESNRKERQREEKKTVTNGVKRLFIKLLHSLATITQ